MAESSTIGASFSQYTGEAALGGYGLGFGRIDSRPFEDLAKYTMLYNREEWLQRQKAKEKELAELAEYTALDLSTTIPKDAKILQDGFDELHNYVKNNPGALNYNNRTEWLKYNKMKADLKNNIKFAKIRSIANEKRKESIAAETNEQRKKFLESELQRNIDQTDIRTPLNWDQKYDLAPIEIPVNEGVKVDVTKAGSNQIFQRNFTIFDIKEAERAGAAMDLGIAGIKTSETGGALRMMGVDENPWIQMRVKLNQALDGAKDQQGNVDLNKLSDLPITKNIQAYNEYARQMKTAISTGKFTDKFGNQLSFMNIPFGANDYKEINLNDGLSTAELGMVASFSKWAGDQYDTKINQTDDAIQQRGLDLEGARLAEQRRQFDLGFGERQNKAMIGAGSVLSTIQNALSTGKRLSVQERTAAGVTSKEDVVEIADVNMLNELKTLNKDGTAQITPNTLYYYPDTKRMELVYFKKDDDGNVLLSDKTKMPVIESRVPMSASDWVSSMTGKRFGADDKGDVNNIVMQELGKYEYDLDKFSKEYKGKSPQATQSESSSKWNKYKVKE